MEANGRNPKKKGKGGSGSYKQEKWVPHKPGELGVCYVNGTPYAYCGKMHNGIECDWNTNHSTKFHKKWATEGTAFNLASECPSHELVLKSNTEPNPSPHFHPLLLESLPLPTMLSYLILSRPCLVSYVTVSVLQLSKY